MNGEMRMLVGKDLRQMRGSYVALGALLLAGWYVFLTRGRLADWSVAVTALALLPSAYLGALTFAAEKQVGSIHFLVSMPVSRGEIFRSKLATTAPVAVACLFLAMVAFLYSATRPEAPGYIAGGALLSEWAVLAVGTVVLVAFAALLYCGGVLMSLLADTVVIATLGAIAIMVIFAGGAMLVFGKIMTSYPDLSDAAMGILVGAFGVVGLAIAAGALLGARRIFCGPGRR